MATRWPGGRGAVVINSTLHDRRRALLMALVGQSAGQIGSSVGLPVSRLVGRSVRGKGQGGHGDEKAGGAGSSPKPFGSERRHATG